MGTIKILFVLCLIGGIIYCCWQVVPPEMANYEFQDDLHDLAMTAASQPNRQTDDDLRNAVLTKAQSHDIQLTDAQVTVQHISSPGFAGVFLAADYNVQVILPGYSLNLHFTPNSGSKSF